MILCVSPGPPGSELDELRAQIGRDLPGTTLTLGPLGVSELAELVGSLMPDLDPEERDRLARRVAADTAGIPLLALQIFNAVRLGMELGRFTSWPEPFRTLVQTFPGDLPDSVVAAIRVGFRRLTPHAQTALAAASVLGDRVPAATLGAACGIEGTELTSALDELEWQRWLAADARGYSFVARIVQEVVAEDMLTPGQRHRYRAAAGLPGE